MKEQVRVLRIIEYVGDRDWVESQVALSIHGTKIPDPIMKPHNQIRAATIGTYPEILNVENETSESEKEIKDV